MTAVPVWDGPQDVHERLKDGDLIAKVSNKIGAVLVVGSGISGMQAALDLAESGYYVYLLDQDQAIGGLMSRLDKTFPTNDCAMCVMSPKLVDCGRHLNIEIITYAHVKGISGEPGNYKVKILRKAKSVDETKCTGCGECVTGCPSRYLVKPPPDGARYNPVLSDDERSFLDGTIDQETDIERNLLGVLQQINVKYRYLPEHILEYLVDSTGVPLARLVSIATFYNAFSLERKGEHTILLCMGTACYVKGSAMLLARLEEILGIRDGQTTADDKFTIQTVRCIGCCALAPAVRIGEETFARVRPGSLDKILGKF